MQDAEKTSEDEKSYAALNKLTTVWKSKSLSTEIKTRVLDTLVIPIVWIKVLNNEERRRTKNPCHRNDWLRRLLSVSRLQHIRNMLMSRQRRNIGRQSQTKKPEVVRTCITDGKSKTPIPSYAHPSRRRQVQRKTKNTVERQTVKTE